MNSRQMRMARAASGLGVREAAALAGVSPDTIVAIEAGRSVKASTVAKVRAAFEEAGVVFTDEGGLLGVSFGAYDGAVEAFRKRRAEIEAESAGEPGET